LFIKTRDLSVIASKKSSQLSNTELNRDNTVGDYHTVIGAARKRLEAFALKQCDIPAGRFTGERLRGSRLNVGG
jgi:hypothetical protein